MTTSENKKDKLSQQEYLRGAMTVLGMSREEFASRLGTSKRRLDNWLLPSESNGFREMDEVVWKFIREILEAERKKPD